MSQRELEGECGSDLCGPNGKGTRAGMGGGGRGGGGVDKVKGYGRLDFSVILGYLFPQR